ncbi:succinate dehydrogenase, cytochrome b556 subunit [Pseudoalteromonas luteoviolacea]|uniref:Succinate dehydrogenase cytochrome b556 subunit n=1 Tax=Pseudoalteromonas luteoviolacea TaxID=43657 RepID=A0A1C0TPH2_9GAMM|nr:succinate dehydrogenase, cytochrome b556 subunit [Pseudoalteromonas luteoviolacea]MBQ4811809.1 succinate dehydrogenase, cytochrome b556 subunit [Pseudoalteromonas luteoviolacea]OCQ20851.1 succinate dehydrogenase, cytochrome b556 subunit [Pseudoalteromonas luteoviolacea]
MRKERPTNLAIQTMALPITAYASILHRVSGVIVWGAAVVLLPLLIFAMQSAQNFDTLSAVFNENFFAQFVVWGLLTALGYYCLGTLKHIIQEFGYFEELASGCMISRVAIGLGVVLSIVVGVLIWL